MSFQNIAALASLNFFKTYLHFGKYKSCRHKKVFFVAHFYPHFPNNFTQQSRVYIAFSTKLFRAFLHSAVDWNFLNRKCESKFWMKMILCFNLSSTALNTFIVKSAGVCIMIFSKKNIFGPFVVAFSFGGKPSEHAATQICKISIFLHWSIFLTLILYPRKYLWHSATLATGLLSPRKEPFWSMAFLPPVPPPSLTILLRSPEIDQIFRIFENTRVFVALLLQIHFLLQVALAPLKIFSKYLLDNEETQHRDGVRAVVNMLKMLGTFVGLRRKVDQEHNEENHMNEPPLRSEDHHGTIFNKHTELWHSMIGSIAVYACNHALFFLFCCLTFLKWTGPTLLWTLAVLRG